mmetsp:Transcript_13840/g.18922  ORF Transcript_13840/g.18922 Transcript_13840/m.18922 type:complete len:288 (+) Transcript_13840:937-1800(+)|eukprot:CAMPEP_0170059322 /NCGR_PEP_ID=MMETSP0019_2-20121128/1639_1 /TAXON_ID=98059 /ORGANISM="Dinobryon sp., Strain UTEXLB2267" /LENGTH=287 /DNA_ID=CAMNT_0010264535 /DNA_START=55 /DNA_END=918 /DNA_ORIENTATION=-
MSTAEEAQIVEKKREPRRRSSNRRRRNPKKAEESLVADKSNDDKIESEKREPKPRPVSMPVPPNFIGTKVNGIISAVVRKGRLRFGFIHIGEIELPEEEKPRIYFNFEEFVDKTVTPRRGYLVEFTCKADEKGRPYASEVSLTEEGKVYAAEREAAIAAKKAEKMAEGEGNAAAPRPASTSAPRERKNPREKRIVEGKKITLLVGLEGGSESKEIVVDLSQSIGRLKTNAAALFDAPNHFNVFHNGIFLTKAILIGLSDRDLIQIGEPRETAGTKAEAVVNGSNNAN